ncbi:hypothetical protein [Sorangium sp. So ce1078]|uniref:hypothetical protein n=1 Tax=Sorangium sp. So ce1078 TaxID=3133329 RepID=UPI003F60531C
MLKTARCSLLAIGLAACTSSAGRHRYDHHPDPGDVYVKNAAVALDREYWVIYDRGDGKHYIFPRPDGDKAIAAECAAGGPKAPIFSAAMLCEVASSKAAVDRVNSLSRDEAIEVSTFLHARLKFKVTPAGGIEPHVFISDQVDVCNTYRSAREGALKSLCDRELGYVANGQRPDIGIGFTAAEAAALAPLLNDIYGIP